MEIYQSKNDEDFIVLQFENISKQTVLYPTSLKIFIGKDKSTKNGRVSFRLTIKNGWSEWKKLT